MTTFARSSKNCTSLPEAAELLPRLAHLPHLPVPRQCRRDAKLGRYSFLAADPFDYFELSHDDRARRADGAAEKLSRFPSTSLPELPPFQGRLRLLSYDLGRQWEPVAASTTTSSARRR